MRRAVKFLHTVASGGMIGAFLGYLVILAFSPQGNPQALAVMRETISALCSYLLLPSLAVALVSGLLSMVVHKPFMEHRWVWAKAVLGLSLFEATLAVIHAKAASASEEAVKIAAGGGDPAALASVVANEWMTLYALLALCAAQVALGVWRPRLGRLESGRHEAERRDGLARRRERRQEGHALRALREAGPHREIIILVGDRDEPEAERLRHRPDCNAPVGTLLRHRGGDGVVGARLVPVARRLRALEQAVDQRARAGARVAVDHEALGGSEGSRHGGVEVLVLESCVTLAEDEALQATPAPDQRQPLAEEGAVVEAALRVEQMDRRDVALTALQRRESALASEREDAARQTVAGQLRCDRVEPGTVAPHDDEIRDADMGGKEGHLGCRPCWHGVGERLDREEAIGLREGCDRAGALANRCAT